MDLEKLQIFYAVAKTGSITEAAIALDKNKSNISRAVKSLEEDLNLSLLVREHKKVMPTDKGILLMEKLNPILANIHALKEELADSENNELEGELRISTTHALASTWLTEILPGWLNMHPKLKTTINATSDIVLPGLNVDVSLRPYMTNQEGLIQDFVRSWKIQLFASPEYLKKNGKPKELADLNDHQMIVFGDSPTLYSRQHVHWPLMEKGSVKRSPQIVINSLHGMKNLVESGMGIGTFASDNSVLFNTDMECVLENEFFKDVDLFFISSAEHRNVKKIVLFKNYIMEHHCDY